MKNLLSSDFRKNAFRLLSANVISQIIGLAVYPIVTRLYTPEEFGIYNVFGTICGILFILGTARYEYAIVLPKSTRDAAAIVKLCVGIALGLSLFLLILLLLFSSTILSIFHIEALGKVIYFMPLLVLINSLSLACMYWFNRQKKFNIVSNYWINQNLVNNFLKVILGFLKQTKDGLVYAFSAGVLAGLLTFLKSKSMGRNIRLWINIDKMRVKEMAKTYKSYPLYNLPHAFINMLSMSFPVLLFGHFFGNEMVGFYGLAILISFRPLSIVINSFYQVYFQRISDLTNKKNTIYPIFKKFCTQSFSLLLPVFIFIYFLSVPMVRYFFGSEWIETAHILRILLPWLLICFITGVFEFIPGVFFCQRKALFIEIFYAFTRLLSILIGVYLKDYYTGLIIYSFVSVGFKFYQLMWFKTLILKYEKQTDIT